jgi:hypothetical protein
MQYRLLVRVSGNMSLLAAAREDAPVLRSLVDAVKVGRARARVLLLERDRMAIARSLVHAAEGLRKNGHRKDASEAEDLAVVILGWPGDTPA